MNAAFWVSAWLLASLPWCNAKRFGLFGRWSTQQANAATKPLWCTLLESALLYSLAFGVMFVIETKQGERAVQSWQFWVIAACLWVVLAFPAAAWTKLRKQ
jgi:hypothetical protein